MRCSHCGICCTETEMLLSKKDIALLGKQGFDTKFFVKFDRHGFAHLKNMDGYCVFYNRIKQRCRVYINRPAGCRVYPVILDEETGIILDNICPERNTITEVEKSLKGRKVVNLLDNIDREAANRQKKP
jgi:Fe-S-cluster containining protein